MINGLSIIQPQTLLKIKLKISKMPKGIMFHHFHGKGHLKSLGSISKEEFKKIIKYLRKKYNLISADTFLKKAKNKN